MADHESVPVSEHREYAWESVHELPCELWVEVPVPGFCIRDLLRLRRHRVVDTHWSKGADVPLRVNGELIGWAEFEVIGNRLAARLTELA